MNADRVPPGPDRAALERALARLDPDEQLAVRGPFVDRRSVTDVASALGITTAEASALRARALLRLARILGDPAQPD